VKTKGKTLVRLALSLGFLFLALAGVVLWESRDLPGTGEIRRQLWSRYHPHGQATWMPLWAISPRLQTAVVTWEDPRFYIHHGFDYPEIWRAMLKDMATRSYRTGGSTITQQVAKNLFLSPEKTLRRKLREAIMARRLEQALSKDEIMEVYLNIADWGDNVVGAEAAVRAYFGKSAGELTWGEAAVLAGILANPHRFSPIHAPQEARRRRQQVLMALALDERITPDELRQAFAEPCCTSSSVSRVPTVRELVPPGR
jgi:membrane peptidoglycan carboxypeptidase